MFITIYQDDSYYVGKGTTLESAYAAVEEAYEADSGEPLDREEVEFFEADKVEVTFKIVRKEVVSKVTVKK